MPSYRMYGNLQLMLRHNVDLGMAGHLHYLAQAGVTFGQVPYPLLHLFSGNQTYTFDPYRFSMMNNYQYAADKYLSLQANWNGGGVLFNQIPGLKYLRLRELLEVKMAWGGLNDKHKSVIDFPKLSHNTQTNYSLLTAPTVPYVELGVGIGNIFRLGELYSVWRLTHLKDAYTPYWSMRFRLFLGL